MVVAVVQNQNKQRYKKLPELESVHRITNIPIVEIGWNIAGQVYQKLKSSNNLLHWTFDQAETSLYNVIDTAAPMVFLVEGPLTTIDKILCRSLDVVETKMPVINFPPQMIYLNTKQYVSDVGKKIVKPVLKRADSVKQIGNSVLSSKYTAFAADKLDGALDVADMYVDKYLPADVFDSPGSDDAPLKQIDGPAGKAIHTSQHMYRFSKKLQRRLTRCTLLEAKALKEHSAEAIHVLVYVAELVVTDPKLALQKGRELWASLSKDEPENQARPENLEQLIVLLTRETARRVVHLVNFTATGLGKAPMELMKIINSVSTELMKLVDSVLKTVHLDGARQKIWSEAQAFAHSITVPLKKLNMRTTDLLEQLAAVLSAQNQQPSSTKQSVASINIMKAVPVPPLPPPLVEQNVQNATVQDTLRPPTNSRTQLKATHRQMNSISNGESMVKT